jgi:hypothetical protein
MSLKECFMQKSNLIQIVISLLLVVLIIVCNGVYLYFFEGFNFTQAIQRVGLEFSSFIFLVPLGFILALLVVLISKISIRKKK